MLPAQSFIQTGKSPSAGRGLDLWRRLETGSWDPVPFSVSSSYGLFLTRPARCFRSLSPGTQRCGGNSFSALDSARRFCISWCLDRPLLIRVAKVTTSCGFFPFTQALRDRKRSPVMIRRGQHSRKPADVFEATRLQQLRRFQFRRVSGFSRGPRE